MSNQATIPAFPNYFPYNELLLRQLLFAKTRNWIWNHTGPTLLYTSTNIEPAVIRAYHLNPKDFSLGALVGIGDLQPVRKITQDEVILFEDQCANYTDSLTVSAGLYIFQFENLRRFRNPIPYEPPENYHRTFDVPISVITEALSQLQ